MKQKWLFAMCSLAVLMAGAAGFAACRKEPPAPEHIHTMTHYPAAEAGCTTAGNTEYWACTGCGKYFSDTDGTDVIAKDSWIIPAKGHTFSETWTYDDAVHYRAATCEHKGERADEGEHTFSDGVCTVCGCSQGATDGLLFTVLTDGRTSYYAVTGIGSVSRADIVIPAEYRGLPVKEIGAEAFAGCSALKSVTLPEGLEKIGTYAFYRCSALERVVFPESLRTFGEEAFADCSALKSVTLPAGLDSIGRAAFSGCDGITDITLPFVGEADGADGRLGYIFGESRNSNENVPASLRTVVLTGGTQIPARAFEECGGLENVTLPAGLESIGERAFAGCSALKSVVFPESLRAIGEEAFANCRMLEQITFPAGLESIGVRAFEECASLAGELVIPDSVVRIGERAFAFCTALGSVAVGGGVKDFGEHAFAFCYDLTRVTVKAGAACIGKWAFYYCVSLAEVTIGEGVATIGAGAFAWCEALSGRLVLPDSVKEIGSEAFAGCEALTGAVLGRGVERIGYGAFYQCYALSGILLPESVTTIEESAFERCHGLQKIYYGGTQEAWGRIAIAEGSPALASATVYFYSETPPTEEGNFWHCGADGVIEEWQPIQKEG